MSYSVNSVTLFQFENTNISIHIKAYFDNENRVIEGYDIGKSVKEAWGDSDYEYSTTIPEFEVKKLFPLFNVSDGDKSSLLIAIRDKYNSNTCYRLLDWFKQYCLIL